MNASTHNAPPLDDAATGADLNGDQNDARSPNPAPSAPAPGTSSTPASTSPSVSGAPVSGGTSGSPDAAAMPDASQPGTEPPSEAGKSDKPKVPVADRDAQGELPSPGAVGEAG